MATLQTIRTKAGLLVAIVIGISLAAFILGDMFQGGSSILQGNRMEVGEVNGESIQYPQFQQEVEKLGDIYRMNTSQNQLDENTWVQVREQTWQTMIRDIVMNDVYKKIGITVSSDELFDMLQGTNLHPIVQQLFRNPNTGQVDRGAVVQFLKNLETGVAPEQRHYWLYLENQIVDERIQSKYNSLVGKGLYVTSQEASNSLAGRNKEVSFDYVALNHTSVADSQVVVTEKDLKDYYNKNQDTYKQEKLRQIEYITFPVEPSEQDFKDTEKWINDVVSDFASATDNAAFVNSNSDVDFDDTWYKQSDLPEDIATWVFENDAKINDIFGPYFEDNAYKLAKLHASEMLPDSVEARHILLQVNTQQELIAQQALADSLKTAIENGSDFSKLAMEFSADQGSAIQGGELGWFGRGQMVKPFEEAAFNNKVKEVSVVTSQFGIHIIQTTARGQLSRQVQIAYLVRNVTPSTQTYQSVYAKASEFAGKNVTKEDFDAAATEQKINKRSASLRETDRQVAALENSRQLVRAAFSSKVGSIVEDQQGSTIFDFGDNFVIATLVSASEEGVASFESVKARVELAVLKEKKLQFLAEKAKKAMEGKTDLEAIASELGSTVKNAANINLTSIQIPGIGMEPKVVGTATNMSPDQISQPVAGKNGVYIIKVITVNEGDNQDTEGERARLAQSLTFRAASQAYNVHREKAEIEDERSKFY
ncbi:peptidyl-prolyl cis-trans isomerase D [Mariniphaga anaerophila]|uniref:Periplasmic chaperone PpiD n=1 Tax=Mariniphaga anaerophila TaxID=1484053 RepID=A0A1M5C9P1_9BACT|nr:SurA N-terminal domain-containing protein [Mariniphaga anaerophila]SHF51463.1 peptidyl-prolyl cis-trans isomerase D [Mariniphaga anaerophila]